MSQMEAIYQIPKPLLMAMSQLCELEQKITKLPDAEALRRHITRMKDAFEELHLVYEYPLGQGFNETRTDVDAHISGASTENLEIVEVMKPIIRYSIAGTSRVIQKGVVVVSAR